MKSNFYVDQSYWYCIFLLIVLGGCMSNPMRPMHGFNDALVQTSKTYREPSVGNKWLVALASYQGKDQIEMFDVRTRKRVPLPGINRADSQPISVSVSADGARLAFVQQRSDRTELFIYRRKLGTLQRIDLTQKGIPRRVTLDSSGKVLAVQVSRQGRWDVEIIRLQG